MINDIEIIDPEKPTTSEEVGKFELLIQAKLPENYKQFLLKNNGGHPIADTYCVTHTRITNSAY